MQKVSTARIALKWGMIAVVAIIVYSTVLFVSGAFMNPTYTWLSYLILASCLYMAIKEFKNENGDFLSIGQGVGVGALASTVTGLISSLFSGIYMTFVDGTIQKQMLEKAREDMEARGLPDDAIDQGIAMSEKFMTPSMMVLMGTIGFAIMGVIISLIISAILKRNKPMFQ